MTLRAALPLIGEAKPLVDRALHLRTLLVKLLLSTGLASLANLVTFAFQPVLPLAQSTFIENRLGLGMVTRGPEGLVLF